MSTITDLAVVQRCRNGISNKSHQIIKVIQPDNTDTKYEKMSENCGTSITRTDQ